MQLSHCDCEVERAAVAGHSGSDDVSRLLRYCKARLKEPVESVVPVESLGLNPSNRISVLPADGRRHFDGFLLIRRMFEVVRNVKWSGAFQWTTSGERRRRAAAASERVPRSPSHPSVRPASPQRSDTKRSVASLQDWPRRRSDVGPARNVAGSGLLAHRLKLLLLRTLSRGHSRVLQDSHTTVYALQHELA